MASGICYTQSGSTKKYESDQLGLIPTYVTGYTVGYPSTAYYSYAFDRSDFYCFAYPGPPGFPQHPGFTEGTAEYIYNVSLIGTDTYNKIYNLMTDTPPDGFVLDKNGKDYIVTKFATVYSCNLDVNYGGVINSINGGTRTIEREFRYKKKDKPSQTTDINYQVTISKNGSLVHCSCQKVTWIDGTNNGNVVLGVRIGFAGYNGGYGDVRFDWEMKNGINETKSIPIPNSTYSGSGFTTRSTWQVTNSDGSITNYRFVLQVR